MPTVGPPNSQPYILMKRAFSFLLLCSLCASGLLGQVVPSATNYQGRLTDANGNPAPDGSGYEVEVRLWPSAAGTTGLLWGSRYSGVTVKGGALNLILGSGGQAIAGAQTTDIKVAVAGSSVFLGLTVRTTATGTSIANPTEILPRQEWLSSPFAFRANSAGFADTIGDNSVTNSKIVDASVSTAKIASGSITTDKIAAASIPPNKLIPAYLVLAEKLPSGTAPQTAILGWQTRSFNTIEASAGDNFAFNDSTDTITLTPGVYEVKGQISFLGVWGKGSAHFYGSTHLAALKRISNGELLGLTARHSLDQHFHSVIDASTSGIMEVSTILTVTQTESFTVVHNIKDLVNSAFSGTDGQPSRWGFCGKASSIPNTPEVYSRITIKALK